MISQEEYLEFKESSIKGRYIHLEMIEDLLVDFNTEIIGTSENNHSIHSIRIGNGNKKILPKYGSHEACQNRQKRLGYRRTKKIPLRCPFNASVEKSFYSKRICVDPCKSACPVKCETYFTGVAEFI